MLGIGDGSRVQVGIGRALWVITESHCKACPKAGMADCIADW